jgi:hypothetical protein
MRKQKTRKRVRNQSRHKRHTKRRRQKSQRSQRLKGGNYADDITTTQVDGIPVTDDAVITIPGYPSMDAGAFKRHAEYRDFQGEEQ